MTVKRRVGEYERAMNGLRSVFDIMVIYCFFMVDD